MFGAPQVMGSIGKQVLCPAFQAGERCSECSGNCGQFFSQDSEKLNVPTSNADYVPATPDHVVGETGSFLSCFNSGPQNSKGSTGPQGGGQRPARCGRSFCLRCERPAGHRPELPLDTRLGPRVRAPSVWGRLAHACCLRADHRGPRDRVLT